VSEVTGKPMLIVETDNGRVFTTKAKEVWPGKQVGEEAIEEDNQ